MNRSSVVAAVLVALSVGVSALPAQTQDPRPEATPNGGMTAAPFAVVPQGALASSSVLGLSQGQAADHKDPMVAGLLSWILPGVGSFYAGNSGHGIRHIVIEAGGLVLVVVGAAQTVESCDINGCSSGSWGLYLAGVGVLVINDIWAIFTAVGDANAHNAGATPARQPGRVVGSLYVDPQIRILRTNAGTVTKNAFGLQVGRVAF